MEHLRNWVAALTAVPQEQFFDSLVQKMNDHFDVVAAKSGSGIKTNSHIASLTTVRKSNKSQLSGLLFEQICYRLLECNAFPFLKVKRVWFATPSPDILDSTGGNNFKVLPPELAKSFSLPLRKDMGIDLVAETTDGKWLAIQCKYRRKPKYSCVPGSKCSDNPSGIRISWSVPWKDISTFLTLCARSGPSQEGWFRHVVITSATSIRYAGRKSSQERSICVGTLRKIPKGLWMDIVGLAGRKLNDSIDVSESVSESVGLERDRQMIAVDRTQVRSQREAFLSRFG